MDPVLISQLPIFIAAGIAVLCTFAWMGLMGWVLFRVVQTGQAPSGLAIGAMVLHVTGAFCGPFVLLTQGLSLVMGIVALRGADATEGPEGTRALARGVVQGSLLLLGMVVVLVIASLVSVYLPALLG